MTLEEVDRAIGEYEKALELAIRHARHQPNQIGIRAEGGAPIPAGYISKLLSDIEALTAVRAHLEQDTEGEQE